MPIVEIFFKCGTAINVEHDDVKKLIDDISSASQAGILYSKESLMLDPSHVLYIKVMNGPK